MTISFVTVRIIPYLNYVRLLNPLVLILLLQLETCSTK